MDGAQRKSNAALGEELAAHGHQFGFFAAVTLLHRLSKQGVPVGELGPLREEVVRFRHATSLSFHSSDIESIIVPENGPIRLTSTFLGLFGASSPLATQLCEDVLRAEEEDQPQLRAFYDLFHHRLISLYYRAWKKYRLAASFREDTEDIATKRMLCMVGVDAHGVRAESGLNRLEVLELAPLLSMRSRPPRVLVLALERLLPGLTVRLEQFVERKAVIDWEDRMQVGVRCNRLGVDYTLGARVLDRTARFRVILGPVDYDACETFMPGGPRYPVLRRVIEQFTRGTLECEVDVLLNDEQAPGYCLGSQRGSLLGFNTRLGRGTAQRRSLMRVLLTDNPDDARPTLIEMPGMQEGAAELETAAE